LRERLTLSLISYRYFHAKGNNFNDTFQFELVIERKTFFSNIEFESVKFGLFFGKHQSIRHSSKRLGITYDL
jgi:hypothetical protein